METIKVKDMVGNQDLGFRFQVMEIIFEFDYYQEFIVEDITTFKKFKTSNDIMKLRK
jgi:hypothetical protein